MARNLVAAGLDGTVKRSRPDVMFVDAPVSGSKGPAEAGQLLILASGPAAAEAIVAPAFSAIGRKTVWLGQAGQGSRMKLVVNGPSRNRSLLPAGFQITITESRFDRHDLYNCT